MQDRPRGHRALENLALEPQSLGKLTGPSQEPQSLGELGAGAEELIGLLPGRRASENLAPVLEILPEP